MARSENKDKAATATQLASEIARLMRLHAGLTQEQVGAQIGYTGSAISALETGAQPATENMLDALEKAIGGGIGIFTAAKKYLMLDKYPADFRDYAPLERKALSVSSYMTFVVDGLYQTEDYARAIIGGSYPPLSEARVEELVGARMARKALFDREPTALLELILEESVLHRPFGSRDIMRDQLTLLAKYAKHRNVTIQVLPMDGGLTGDYAGDRGSMKLLETPDHRTVVFVDGQGLSKLISDPAEVTERAHRYAKIRAQSLSPLESLNLIERLAGEQ
ncbi:helix-turn-helix domain-containing protein [Streptomyces roseoverticillatus]|uniref:helix-turn-helix domain-containing protein n=1 Tax=Streptomyces roseoverticillatus TaxID=66429 RepID=UPI001F2B2CA1|nr:helix-turn-helix transcriptional regulator [Streptomyces roseoverticillatus]MCF3107054.1 helix-turn-helix domain-containing protein [Streptomyces roseoverticillatus]